MSIGEIVNAAGKIYRERWAQLLGVAVILMIPISAVNAVMASRLPNFEPGDIPSGEEISEVLSVIAVAALIQALISPVLTGALTWIGAKTFLGEPSSGQEALRVAASKLLPLIWVGILTFLVVIGGFILLIIPGIIFWLRLTFGSTAVVLENLNGTRALGRSWRLTKGFIGKVFLTLLLTVILVGIAGLVIGYPFGIIGDALGGPLGILFTFVGDALAGTVATPFAILVIVLLYFDLRSRQERIDASPFTRDPELAP